MKKRKSEGDATPTANDICLKQAGNQLKEAKLYIAKHDMTNRPLLLAENVATAKAAPPYKYAGK